MKACHISINNLLHSNVTIGRILVQVRVKNHQKNSWHSFFVHSSFTLLPPIWCKKHKGCSRNSYRLRLLSNSRTLLLLYCARCFHRTRFCAGVQRRSILCIFLPGLSPLMASVESGSYFGHLLEHPLHLVTEVLLIRVVRFLTFCTGGPCPLCNLSLDYQKLQATRTRREVDHRGRKPAH